MTVIHLYHFEDDEEKRDRLGEIIAGLNVRGEADGIQFTDAIGKEWAALVSDPPALANTVIKCSQDPEAIALVDVKLGTPNPDPTIHPYNQAADHLRLQLQNDGQDAVLKEADLLVPYLKRGKPQRADVNLSAVMVSLFRASGARFLWASNQLLANVENLPVKFADSVSIPEGPPEPGDLPRISKVIDNIYQMALGSSWLDLGSFIRECADFTPAHPTLKEDVLKASELLRRCLRLGRPEFKQEFCSGDGDLLPNTLEAIKILFGARTGVELRATYLLGLCAYRTLFAQKRDWQQKWRPDLFRKYQNSSYVVAYPIARSGEKECRLIRLSTLNIFADLFCQIFADKDTKEDIVKAVELSQECLEFRVAIDFELLRSAIMPVFRCARGEHVDLSTSAHDTSTALLRFVVSSVLHVTGTELISAPHAPLTLGHAAEGIYVRFGKH